MIGQQVGPYKILKLLGQGGMGIVYQGMHAKLEQPVAIKVLSPEFSANLDMRERFVREAKLQVKLSHPNVVNILNYLEDGTNVFLVMEYVHGDSLETRIKQGKPMGTAECCRIILSVLDALAFMHQRGIIHRDIKPSNIMLTEDGQVKVTDFGIAKAAGEKGITKTGTQLGTIWYMAPEQIRGGNVDATSDMYALGITLYQMLTGQVPFHSDSDFAIMKAHVEEPPQDPAVLNPLIPRALCNVILKVLAKNPQERFQSAEELKTALLQVTDAAGKQAGVAFEHALPTRDSGVLFELQEGVLKAKAVLLNLFSTPAEVPLFLGRFNRNIMFLFMGMALILAVFLMYMLFFNTPGGEKSRRTPIPLTLGPGSPFTVTSGNHSQLPESSPFPAPNTGMGGAPPGLTGAQPIATPPPRAGGFLPEIQPGQLRPQPLSVEPESAQIDEPAKPEERQQNIEIPEQAIVEQNLPYSKNKKPVPPTTRGEQKSNSVKKSAGEKSGWSVIK